MFVNSEARSNISPRQAAEKEFTFNGFNYAAQEWEATEGVPMLALHGWLDNSASFSVLADHLPGVHLLAPDLAGHGLSDHRLGFADYPLWSEMAELCAMADAMAWERFALVGHSRGAMMALLLAAAVPERISHLILLDAVCPLPTGIEDTASRFQRKFKSPFQAGPNPSSFSCFDDAVNARCYSAYGAISRQNAERLAKRGVSLVGDAYQWHADKKLKSFSSVGLCPEQIVSIAEQVSAPTQALMAKEGWMATVAGVERQSNLEQLVQDIVTINNIEWKEFDDGHFLHMENSAASVGAAILEFLRQYD